MHTRRVLQPAHQRLIPEVTTVIDSDLRLSWRVRMKTKRAQGQAPWTNFFGSWTPGRNETCLINCWCTKQSWNLFRYMDYIFGVLPPTPTRRYWSDSSQRHFVSSSTFTVATSQGVISPFGSRAPSDDATRSDPSTHTKANAVYRYYIASYTGRTQLNRIRKIFIYAEHFRMAIIFIFSPFPVQDEWVFFSTS